ncbi:pollen-specific leucine-rich repeat extensin-like protein 3 [Iris pallida]|uniref:Pollen-specific leucine-rich repeat extensin-like protein 3 n=1 Tax=Iris pallida TaxID=29817 RepID=A0AAX6H3V3_IRIPA|nr:pollen-specific leucine-rich repeat extensin-like protein 3 [Iris pallida]
MREFEWRAHPSGSGRARLHDVRPRDGRRLSMLSVAARRCKAWREGWLRRTDASDRRRTCWDQAPSSTTASSSRGGAGWDREALNRDRGRRIGARAGVLTPAEVRAFIFLFLFLFLVLSPGRAGPTGGWRGRVVSGGSDDGVSLARISSGGCGV